MKQALIKPEGEKIKYDPLSGPNAFMPYDDGPPQYLKVGVLEPHPYPDYPPNPVTQYQCPCGWTNFSVHHNNDYETSVMCLRCEERYIAHEG